uniref:Transposase, mutator type n=1 Tax=Tanacetum cinerariifolium TaxID=118510 RepID=A0A699IGY4_TANCI|nr:transposase, mutator type [Tanacetum cinerariifolium]
MFSIKLNHGGKFTNPPKRMYVGRKVNYVVNIDVDLFNVDEVHMFVQDLGLALERINEDDVGEPSVDKNGNVNVNEERRVVVDKVNVDLNVNEEQTVNVDEDSDKENKHDSSEDEWGRGDDREDFILNEEHVIDEVEVNIKGFTFSVEEQGVDPIVTPNVDLTYEALEVLDFDSFDSDVGDDTPSIRKRNLRKLRKLVYKRSCKGPTVGRPGKKGKKSAGEVIEMFKNGKLTRKGETVTCCKCGQKGHNKRSYKGPIVAGSRAASGLQVYPKHQGKGKHL